MFVETLSHKPNKSTLAKMFVSTGKVKGKSPKPNRKVLAGLLRRTSSLMSGIERKYYLTYLTRVMTFSYYFIFDRIVCVFNW